jgi:hypothetical protein
MVYVHKSLIPSLILFALAACGGSGEPSAGDGGGGAQAAVTPSSGGDAVMHSAGETATYTSFPAGPEAQRPSWTVRLDAVARSTTKPDYLLAKVTMAPVADCVVSGMSMCGVSPRHFSIILPDGSKVTGTTLDINETPKLDSVSMRPGDTVTGHVGFAVPPGSGSVSLMYEPYPGQVAPQFGFKIDAS